MIQPLTALPMRPRTALQLQADRRFTDVMLAAAILTGLAGGLFFALRPDIDLVIARQTYADGSFMLGGSDFWWLVRRVTMTGFGIFYVAIILGAILSWSQRQIIAGIYPLEWLYLVICSLAGPLLLTNVILKDNIGRPRPRSITEFGGSLDFKAILERGGGCIDNCSFVSGEVSSMVMIFASLMFVSHRWRRLFLVLLIPAWAFSAFLRIGAGGHFASDTYLAGCLMILIAAFLYRIMLLGGQAPDRV